MGTRSAALPLPLPLTPTHTPTPTPHPRPHPHPHPHPHPNQVLSALQPEPPPELMATLRLRHMDGSDAFLLEGIFRQARA